MEFSFSEVCVVLFAKLECALLVSGLLRRLDVAEKDPLRPASFAFKCFDSIAIISSNVRNAFLVANTS